MNEHSQHLFAYYLEISKAELTPALLDEPAFDELLHIGRQFPASISTFWGFECRLGEMSKKADLLFEIKKKSPAHALLKDLKHPDTDTLVSNSPIWGKLACFATQWGDSSHSYNHTVRNIWLEFDTASITSPDERNKILAQPSVFWGPEPQAKITDELTQVINSVAQVEMSAVRLQSFLKLLPDNAQLFQLGVMSSRQVPIARVCINRLAYNDITPLVKRLNWTGNINTFAILIDDLKQRVKSIAMDLDVTATGIGEKIGLECYMDWECTDASQWLPLLQYLNDRQLLIQEKQEGLLNYPKNIKLDIKKQLKDDSENTVYPLFFQNIHHIKLIFTNGKLSEAKAYLGVYRPGLNKKIFNLTASNEKNKLPQDQWIIA